MKAALACILAAAVANGQWIRQPTAGIPRTPEGKPNLAAPAPRTSDGHPDLTGLWSGTPQFALNATGDLRPEDIAPWARALVERRKNDLMKDHPSVLCLPSGLSYTTFGDFQKFLQTPTTLVILHPDLTYRQIYMDGRALETEPNPAWMGYSVGHWEGDTLVVESNGFNDRTWLDGDGHPHSEKLKTTERYRRSSFGKMELTLTLEDPGIYAKPWTLRLDFNLVPDTEMIEYVCAENEKDRAHLVGKASDIQQRDVPIEVLGQFVGSYRSGNQVLNVELKGNLPVLRFGGFSFDLIPVGPASLSSPLAGQLDFERDAQGQVIGVTMQTVGGEIRAKRVANQ